MERGAEGGALEAGACLTPLLQPELMTTGPLLFPHSPGHQEESWELEIKLFLLEAPGQCLFLSFFSF